MSVVRAHVKLNKPGKNDPLMEVWIDGVKVMRITNKRSRLVQAVQTALAPFFNICHGGMVSTIGRCDCSFTAITAAKRYIGPPKRV